MSEFRTATRAERGHAKASKTSKAMVAALLLVVGCSSDKTSQPESPLSTITTAAPEVKLPDSDIAKVADVVGVKILELSNSTSPDIKLVPYGTDSRWSQEDGWTTRTLLKTIPTNDPKENIVYFASAIYRLNEDGSSEFADVYLGTGKTSGDGTEEGVYGTNSAFSLFRMTPKRGWRLVTRYNGDSRATFRSTFDDDLVGPDRFNAINASTLLPEADQALEILETLRTTLGLPLD